MIGRRKRPPNRTEELTRRARAEARALSRKRRIEARRAMRAQAKDLDVGVKLRGAGMETRRQLRPVVAPVTGLFSRTAPYITRGLLFVIQLVAALIALVMELARVTIGRLGSLLGIVGVTVYAWLQRHLTPRVAVAFVAAGAAVLLGISQFADYHGVAVDAPNYAGEVGTVASAPLTGRESAGSAHLWVLLPIAALALLLTAGAYRGDRRYSAGIAVCGVLGLAVAFAIDLPQGLDVGRPGLAFYGAEARLLGGFWVEVTASAVLILCGALLPAYTRNPARRRRRSGLRRRDRAPRRDVGGISPGLQAGS
jgi:hypothetical protein